MRIKRLEMQGFKTFADKTEIELANGITAVVGPNGSGKSNLADAIKWVLGEQSVKALRGSRMDEVIFAGTNSRRGVGLAEVTLMFENSSGSLNVPFQEVAVTRRLFRSGESEYYLNKSLCRLKDLSDMFLDTGVGKDAYSFIGQGRIDEILSARPEDRRAIFEEVAGIAKYKARKRETLNKLQDTEQSLTRINDLLYELQKQEEPLQEEARKAREYLQIEAERKRWERELLLYEISMSERRLLSIERQKEQLADQVSTMQHQILGLEAEEERLRLSQTIEQEAVNQLNQQLLSLVHRGERIQSEEGTLRTRIAEKEQGIDELLRQRAQLDERGSRLKSELATLRDKLSETGVQLSQRQGELSDLNSALDALEAGSNNTQLVRAEEALGELSRRRADLELTKARLSERLERQTQELSAVEGRSQQITNQLQVYSAEKQEIEQDLQCRTEQKQQLQEQQSVTSRQIAELSEQYSHLDQEVRRKQQEAAATASRLRLLSEVVDAMEGYQRGVRSVMQASRQSKLDGIVGVIGELVHVSAELEMAVEVALGGSLQNVVASTEDAARRAIEHLKRHNAGRATFLPLDAVRPRPRRDVELRAAQMPGAVGFAADLVTFDQGLENVVQSLLGSILIVENLEQAIEIARRCQHQIRMVTLEGDVLMPGGSLSGGSRNQQGAGLLGRQREMNALSERQSVLAQELKDLAQQQQALQQRTQRMQQELKVTEDALRQLHLKLQELDSRKRSVAAVLSNWQEQHEQLQAACTSAAEARMRYADDLNKTEAQLAIAGQAEAEQLAELERLRSQSAGEAERRMQLLTCSHQAELQLTQLREQAASLEREVESLALRQQDCAEQAAANEQEIERNTSALQRDQAALAEKLAEKTDHERLLKLEQDSFAEKQKVLQQLQQIVEDNRQQIRQQREQLDQLRTQLYTVELRLSRSESDRDALLARLEKEHGVVEREGLHSTLSSRGQGESALGELQERLLNLGPVRVGSIQELERLQERVGFLNAQQTDLVKSRSGLEQIIVDIDELMSRKFADTFVEVCKTFQRLFKELFGGGESDLRLVNPDQPLDTGIDIIVQPPGKKLQNINLLSGGEKALTAIALLSAVLEIKPTPFCILDEIDAALDDANIRRFMQVVQRLAVNTQFIIITHSKETMLAADTLYGITMPEQGISRLFSVKLEDGNAARQVSVARE